MSLDALTPAEEAQLEADLRGERGPEIQAGAESWCFDNGIEIQDAEYDQGWGNEAAAQIGRIEGELERPLTEAERNKMVAHQQESDQVPDMYAAYAATVDRDMRNKDDRQAIGAEIYEEHRAQQEQGKPVAEGVE